MTFQWFIYCFWPQCKFAFICFGSIFHVNWLASRERIVASQPSTLKLKSELEPNRTKGFSYTRSYSAAGKAGLGLAVKETKGTARICVDVCICWAVCVGVPARSWSQGSKVFRGTQLVQPEHKSGICHIQGLSWIWQGKKKKKTQNIKAFPAIRHCPKSLCCPAYPWESLHTTGLVGSRSQLESHDQPLLWVFRIVTVPCFQFERRFGLMSDGARFISIRCLQNPLLHTWRAEQAEREFWRLAWQRMSKSRLQWHHGNPILTYIEWNGKIHNQLRPQRAPYYYPTLYLHFSPS